MQAGTPRGFSCLLQNHVICLPAGPVGWAGHTALSAWLLQHEHLRNHISFSIPGGPSPWESPLQSYPRRVGCPYKRESRGKHGVRKKDVENSISPVYCRQALQFGAAHCSLYQVGGTLLEFGWLYSSFFWVCWALKDGTEHISSVSHWEWLDCVGIISTYSGSQQL